MALFACEKMAYNDSGRLREDVLSTREEPEPPQVCDSKEASSSSGIITTDLSTYFKTASAAPTDSRLYYRSTG